jgi:PAS domain S-box-containing protein
MKKIVNLLPFFALLFLPLLFYPGAGASAWRSSGDVHAIFEFVSALLAITAGIMVLLHFYSTGRWLFLIISIGFVLIGTEEFVHAIFSFSGFWPEPFPTIKLAISTTWLTGHFVLLTSFFIALIFGERRVVPAKRALYAVIYNIIGFICTAFVALLIFKAPFLPGFVQLGTITKKLIELSFALLFFVALLFYAKIYLKQQSRSPLLWGIVACIIFRVLAHVFVFDARAFYDSHWDTAHLLVFLSYFFPIFGVWGETLNLQRSAKAQVLELGKEMAQRKQLEEVLKIDEALFRELYDHMKSGSAIFTVMNDGSKGSDYIIKKINRAGLEMEGKALEDVVGKRLIDIRPAIDSYGLIPVMKKVWETGISAYLPTKIYRDERYLNYYENYIFKLPSGEIVTLYNDVSESKRMEEQLRESEERFRTIACTTPDHILVQDRDLRYTFVVNPQLGLTEADMLGKTDRDILNKEEAENLIAIKTKVIETGVPFHLEASLQNMKGETEYFDGSYIPKFDSTGKSDGLIGYFRNITERKRAEDALQESDVSYRALFENIHSGVAVYTVIDDGRDFIFKDFNRAGEKIDHDQRERLIGKSIFEVRPGVEQFGLTEVFRQVWQTGEPAYHPVTLYQDNLLSGWYENFVYKLPSGEIVAVFEDITERKRAEVVLRESEERYRELFEKESDAIMVIDAETHRFEDVNAATLSLYGYSREEFLALTAEDISAEPDQTLTLIARIVTGDKVPKVPVRYQKKKDGTVFPVEISLGAFSVGSRRKIIGAIRDITERKRAEEALRESQKKFQALAETTNDFVWEMNADGVYNYCSPQINGLWGYKPEDMIGRTPFDIMIPEDRELALKMFRALSKPPNSFKGIVTSSLDNTGRIVVLETSGAPFLDIDGRLLGFRGISRDVTERKLAEEEIRQKSRELQEKNDELNRFVYAVSHDLRSPLVTIQTFQGHLEQDLRSRDAALVAKDLGYIRGAADKMGRLLDELRRLSRVGRIVNPSEEAPLQEIVKEALNLVAGRITDRGMRVDLTKEPVVLYGDRTRLVEIFLNLVDNAAKFMGDQPAPRVEIGVEQAGEELVLQVRDNGIGIGPEVQPLVFGLFHKLDPGSEGEGIGLALVKRIVELHGGRIWVESEGLGKGTTFRFTLAKTRRAAVCGS